MKNVMRVGPDMFASRLLGCHGLRDVEAIKQLASRNVKYAIHKFQAETSGASCRRKKARAKRARSMLAEGGLVCGAVYV